MRLVVIGAGPMGLEAALLGIERGLDVTVLEAGRPGESLRRWGPTRFFSPLGMNVSARARRAAGIELPDEAILTGPELAERVLEPVARALGDRLRTGHRVVAVGRARMLRGDLAGHPLRAERPFQLLVEAGGAEELLEADAVIDASGVERAVAMGAGGLPVPGERALGDRAIRDLGTLHRRRAELGGRRVLLVGHGHSAATALPLLLEAGAELVWVTRSLNARPCLEVACDPLPERREIVARANDLAERPPPALTVVRRASILAFEPGRVRLTGGRSVAVDEIVGLVGYRPELSPLSELAVEISPATEGAGRLARALAGVTDCLNPPRVTPADLASGEPGFWLAGARSYGRARTFLLATGLAHLETILGGLP